MQAGNVPDIIFMLFWSRVVSTLQSFARFVIRFPVLWFGVSIVYVSSSAFFLYTLITMSFSLSRKNLFNNIFFIYLPFLS